MQQQLVNQLRIAEVKIFLLGRAGLSKDIERVGIRFHARALRIATIVPG